MALLTVSMTLLIPATSHADELMRRTRLLVAGCTGSLMLFFLLTYLMPLDTTQLHDRNIATMTCIVFFLPAQYCFNLAALNVLRRGMFTIADIAVGPICYLIILFAIGAVYYVTGTTYLEADETAVRYVEYGSAGLFLLTILYYNTQEVLLLRRDQGVTALDDISLSRDHRWFLYGSMVLMASALPTPFLIFTYYPPMFAAYWLFVFTGLFVCVMGTYGMSCLRYGIHTGEGALNAPVSSDEEPAVDGTMLPADRQRVERAVRRWTERKRYRAKGLTLQGTADEMGVSRIQFTEWLRAVEDTYFSKWVTTLRVEESKRLMVAHPEWDNEKIAKRCGFSSRSYFQRCFRDVVGMTPSAWAEEQ